VKILDFGLAKLTRSETTADAATLASQTEAGMVLGRSVICRRSS
jgi:hypothetical protein